MITGKQILLIMLCLNVSSFMISYGALDAGNIDLGHNNKMLSLFFNLDDISKAGNPSVSTEFTSEVSKTLEAQSTGAQSESTLAFMLDSLKMVLGFLTFITPLPVFLFFISLNIPIFIIAPFLFILFIMYAVSIIEFIRGGSF